jgi:putative MATE family efflux protein
MALLGDTLDRDIARLALPALGTLAVEPLYVLVDTAIVGHLGTAQLGGLALAATALLILSAASTFIAYSTTQRFAHRRGAGRHDEAAAVGVQALWLSALLGIPMAAVVAVLARPVCVALGGHGDVLRYGALYLRIATLGLPFVFVALAGHGVLRAVERLGRPLVIAAIANAVNLVLEIVAVYVLHWGIAGSAWSTVVVQIAAAAFYVRAMAPHLAAARSWGPSRVELGHFLRAGRNLAIRAAAMLAAFVGGTALAARVDTPTLAAHQIGAQAFSFLALGLDALAIPAQTFVAQSLGAGNVPRAFDVGRRVMRLSVLAGTAIGAALLALAWPLPHLFTGDAAVAHRATGALVVLAVVQPIAGIAFGLDGVLIGAGDYRFLGRAAIGNLLAFLPAAAVVVAYPAVGIVGVWLALAAWLTSRALVNLARFRQGGWSRIGT